MNVKENPEARIALCQCTENRRHFGVRVEKQGEDWIATWAFAIKNEESLLREEYQNTKITGTLKLSPGYPGCPYCGGRQMIVCGHCGKLNCQQPESEQNVFVCAGCGNAGEITPYDGTGGVNVGTDL